MFSSKFLTPRHLSVPILTLMSLTSAAQAADLTTPLDLLTIISIPPNTINIGASAGPPYASLNMAGGSILNGTVQSDATSQNLFTQTNSNGTLDNVILNGSLDITGNNAAAIISNSFAINDPISKNGNGVINLTGQNATLTFDSSTASPTTIAFGTTLNIGSPSNGANSGDTLNTNGGLVNEGLISLVGQKATINGNVTNNGHLTGFYSGNSVSPPTPNGWQPYDLQINGNLVLGSGGTLGIDIKGNNQNDLIHVSGDLTLAGGLSLYDATPGYDPLGKSFKIITAGNFVGGSFDDPIKLFGFPPGLVASWFSDSTNQGDNVWVTFTSAPVPLPPALWLFGSALSALGVFGRGRKIVGAAV